MNIWKLIKRLFKEQPEEHTKEDYYNNKYPKYPITYSGRTLANSQEMISIDVRNFFTPYDFELKTLSIFTGDDDYKALKCVEWVIDNITYVTDKSQFGISEEWMFPYETLVTRKGDCDDGAILMANLMLISGIPYWKIRLVAGNSTAGGHCYVTYYVENKDKWVILDWCFWPNKKLIKDRIEYKLDKRYKEVWFSWNQKYSFYKGENEDAEY